MISVSEALKTRTSIRAFRPDPVSEAQVREILDVARWAPSGGNLQPWRVIAVAGAERDAVVALAKSRFMQDIAGEEGGYRAYPPALWEPYRSRRFANGEQMYALLGIPREDRDARIRHVTRNFEFFGAPVGLFLLIDRRMGHAQWAHMGMFMQSIALAATERGLSTCMQEFWGRLRASLAAHFALAPDDMVYCGIALGYADETAPVNQLRSEREEVDGFATFKGF
ncbi:MAG TPA: nitroreductase [Caulobacterales bacterium]|nr:nitroreductase [Caulobacterales bacterium]